MESSTHSRAIVTAVSGVAVSCHGLNVARLYQHAGDSDCAGLRVDHTDAVVRRISDVEVVGRIQSHLVRLSQNGSRSGRWIFHRSRSVAAIAAAHEGCDLARRSSDHGANSLIASIRNEYGAGRININAVRCGHLGA